MRKLLLTSATFMILSISLGFYALTAEPRTNASREAYEAQQIENGAVLYQTHCANCHGLNGRAEKCVDSSGTQIACAGRALNTIELFCYMYRDTFEVPPPYPVEAYITQIAATGNTHDLPPFSQTYGGPLSDQQIGQISSFVANWENDFFGCPPPIKQSRWPSMVSGLPSGNASQGEQLYAIVYGCAACHGNLDDNTSNAVGPWLGSFIENREMRFLPEEIYTDADHFYESTLFPSAHIADNCPTGPCAGPPSSMPDNFGDRMYPQEMADIMSYLLGSSHFTGNIDFAEKHADRPELWQVYKE